MQEALRLGLEQNLICRVVALHLLASWAFLIMYSLFPFPIFNFLIFMFRRINIINMQDATGLPSASPSSNNLFSLFLLVRGEVFD